MATTEQISSDLDQAPAPPSVRSASHPVAAFVARRIGAALLTLLVASLLVFFAVQILPGNVAQVVLGRNATPQRLAAVEADLNLNRPVPVRYLQWLKGLV